MPERLPDMIKTDRIVIALDQSYNETGYAIGKGSKILSAGSFPYHTDKSSIAKLNTLKMAKYDVTRAIDKCTGNGYNNVDVYYESVRLEGRSTFNFLKLAGAMEMAIKQAVYDCQTKNSDKFNINLFSIATISWKSAIVGNIKAANNDLKLDPSKFPTMQKVVELGYEKYLFKPVSKRTNNGIVKVEDGQKYTYNDNIADAICICLYGLLPPEQQKRKDMLE